MVSKGMSSAELQSRILPKPLGQSGNPWLLPVPTVRRGLFELALRAASLAWHPDPTVAPSPVTDPTMAMPVVLAAWRATERELAGMTGDSPEQEYLEANAMMLQAIYQRLYRERVRK